MIPEKSRHAPPKASAMIEALRGLGYSTPGAVADIIDNSISAHATQVDIGFFWDGPKSAIAIMDNGDGMDEAQLDQAMRLGERSPLDIRDPHDLGRFGLGLKTASFSQCRRLTVASRKNESVNCLRWDLDVLAASSDDGWHLLEGPALGSEHILSMLDQSMQGTMVLWESMDRIVTQGFTEQNFLDLIDRVDQHLSLVFHRFISGSQPRVRINIHNSPIKPRDPFLINHTATWSSPVERIPSAAGQVEVQCHVLPHKDRLSTQEYEAAAGPDGWTAHQGFYIFRNERLLVAGNWLGLGRGRRWTKEEAFRLARIRMDIHNTADSEWEIDIRKSKARPPVSIRERLTRLAEDTRERARRVFAHRGQIIKAGSSSPLLEVWQAEHFSGGLRYRIVKDHPAVRAVLEQAGSLEPQIRTMLRVIEETVPVQKIWLDTTEAAETPRTGFAGASPQEIEKVLSVLYKNLVLRSGMSPAIAREHLLNIEPFNNFPEIVEKLPDVLKTMEEENVY